jgi:hypothetical protein
MDFLGEKTSADYFKTDKPVAQGWSEIEKKDLDAIPVA